MTEISELQRRVDIAKDALMRAEYDLLITKLMSTIERCKEDGSVLVWTATGTSTGLGDEAQQALDLMCPPWVWTCPSEEIAKTKNGGGYQWEYCQTRIDIRKLSDFLQFLKLPYHNRYCHGISTQQRAVDEWVRNNWDALFVNCPTFPFL